MKMSKSALVAAAVGVMGLAGVSQAIPVALTSGDIVGNSGWRVTFPVGVTLTETSADSTNLVLQKSAIFDSLEGLDITFTQVVADAAPTITISAESVTNISGSSWAGFQFLLATDTGGTPAAFSGAAFDDFTPPFYDQSDTPNNITLSNGTLPNTQTATWGGEVGPLTIDANPGTESSPKVFELKEIPVIGAVPLPAAALTGLSCLIGLGMVAGARRAWRMMA